MDLLNSTAYTITGHNPDGSYAISPIDPSLKPSTDKVESDLYVNAPKCLGVGALVVCESATYKIVGINNDESYISEWYSAERKPDVTKFIWPVGEDARVSEGFAVVSEIHPNGHRGVDFAVSAGTPIKAIADGIVLQSGWNDIRGNYIYVQHSDGSRAVYQHNSNNLVEKGDAIKQGQTIGTVGSTGNSTGNHLHLELLMKGIENTPKDVIPHSNMQYHVDPLKYLGK